MTSIDGMSKIHGSAPTRGRRVAPLAKEAEVEQWRERLSPGSHTSFLKLAASSDPPVAFPAL